MSKELRVKLIRARDTLDIAVRKYLSENGWNYTCNTPGSYWLWEKKLKDGRTLLLSEDTAVAFQEAWDVREMQP